MTDTIDIDAMKRDMEAGTPGPWDLRLFQSGTVQVIMREWTDGKPNPMSGGSTYGYHSAYLTMNNIGQRNETDTDNEKYHNARRIARVPDLERAALAAEDAYFFAANAVEQAYQRTKHEEGSKALYEKRKAAIATIKTALEALE